MSRWRRWRWPRTRADGPASRRVATSRRRACSTIVRRRRAGARPARVDRCDRGPGGPMGPGPGGPRHEGPWVRLWVGAGRSKGLRPQDLVGAITHEAGVPGRVVGAIRIAEHHALVDVAADVADGVIHALRGATIRGRTVPVRRTARARWGRGPPRHAEPVVARGRGVHPARGRRGAGTTDPSARAATALIGAGDGDAPRVTPGSIARGRRGARVSRRG